MQQLIAKTLAGLEPVLAKELKQIGAKNIKPGNRAVIFDGSLTTLYKANYCLRTAVRILKPIFSFKARLQQHLYKHIYKYNWSSLFNTQQTFAIDATVHSNYFTHSQFVVQKAKDAIVDQFRDKFGRRPSVDIEEPDFRLHIRINKDEVTVSIDSSGFSLHKRGYRTSQHLAPINETLAAGLILTSGWNGQQPYYDLMCGSGTFLVEAAAIATNTPPGYFRNRTYTFENWHDFDEEKWRKIKHYSNEAITKLATPIIGFDIDGRMIEQSKDHLKVTGFDKVVQLKQVSVSDSKPLQKEPGIVIINPPYDLRIKNQDINHLYKTIGDTFKQKYKGFAAWVLSGNKTAIKNIGLRTAKKLTFYNGPVECKFHKYELY